MKTVLTATLVALLFAPSIARASEVTRDWDHTYDFKTVHTFAIKIGTSWGNQLSETRVMNEISQALAVRGWRRVTDGASDVLVVLHGSTETQHTLETFYNTWGGWGWGGWGPVTATTTVKDYVVGTLIVDIFDANTHKLLYRGTASDELSQKPEKNLKKVNKASSKLFKDFPYPTSD